MNKAHLFSKDVYKANYLFFINKRQRAGSKHLNRSKAFIKQSSNMYNIYKNIEEQNPKKV